jgi:hypothetical protein
LGSHESDYESAAQPKSGAECFDRAWRHGLLFRVTIADQRCGEALLLKVLGMAGSPDHDPGGGSPGGLLDHPQQWESPTGSDP